MFSDRTYPHAHLNTRTPSSESAHTPRHARTYPRTSAHAHAHTFRVCPTTTCCWPFLSDTPYAFEEDLTLQQLGCVTDGHPNAYAVRLRVSLAAPVVMDLPWDVCRETVGYITSLSHVAGRCRLTEAEEGMSLVSGAGGGGLEAGIAEAVAQWGFGGGGGEEQGTWAAQKHSEAGYGRPVDRGVWTAKTVKRPRQQPAHPQYANYWATQTAHPATFSTVPTHQLLGSANAETTPAGAPAAAADRKQRPDATCEGKNG